MLCEFLETTAKIVFMAKSKSSIHFVSIICSSSVYGIDFFSFVSLSARAWAHIKRIKGVIDTFLCANENYIKSICLIRCSARGEKKNIENNPLTL